MNLLRIAEWTAAGLLGGGLAGAAQEGRIQGVRTAPPISSVNGFVENLGQWDPEVLFFAREGGIEATVLRDGVLLVPRAPHWDRELQGPPPPAPVPIVLRWEAGSVPIGQGELATRHHYLLGAKANHVSNARGFASVRFEGVAPGIDLELCERGGFFAYDLHAEPGASVDGFAIEVEGVERWEVRAPGVLELRTASGDVVQQRIGPSWQEDPATLAREALAAEFQVVKAPVGALRFGFAAPGRDLGRALVIDPTLEWSTFLGGTSGEHFDSQGMAVDESGAVYMLCWVGGNTPTTPSAYQGSVAGEVDAWVGKLSPDGNTLLWATYLGGALTDLPEGGIAVDQDGSVVVAGSTWSQDFPTTPGTLQPVHGSPVEGSDIFVTRLHPSGSSLVWSTLFGVDNFEHAEAMELFPSGDVLIGGSAGSTIFVPPVQATPGAYDRIYDSGDKIVLRISADGESLVFLTYFRMGTVQGMTVDHDSNIYLCGGWSGLPPAATTPGVFQETVGPTTDGYVAKLNPIGTQLVWGTFVGGDAHTDFIVEIAVDASSAVYLLGKTYSHDFPITEGAFQASMTNSEDGFVAKLLPDASDLAWATYLGSSCGAAGCGGTSMQDLAVDAAGAVFVTGSANEFFFPVTPDAFQPNYVGLHPSGDTFFAKLDPFGERLLYGTWLGGNSNDWFSAIGLDGFGGAYLGLATNSAGFPVTPGSYDPTYNGFGDLAVAKFSFPPPTGKIRKAWSGGKSVLVAGPPPPTPASSNANSPQGSDAEGAMRLSLRGAPALQPGWIIVQRGVLPENEMLVQVPDARIPVTTDEDGAVDVILDRPIDSALTFHALIQGPASSGRWDVSNAIEHPQQMQHERDKVVPH